MTAEFTQHQRDVFCVFSGTMVSKFRDFLNTSPQFDGLWDNSWNRATAYNSGSRPRVPVANQPSAPAGEGADDEMIDDDNDFEGLDGSEMVVDAQAQNPVNGNATNNTNGLMNHGFQQAIPVPPPPPGFALEGGNPQNTTSQASAAPLGHGSPVNGEPSTGASTATIHRPQENGDQSDAMN
jgi:F-box and leucine-rich repeat protein GRR1